MSNLLFGNAHCYGLGFERKRVRWWIRRLTSETRGTRFTQRQAIVEETLRAACLILIIDGDITEVALMAMVVRGLRLSRCMSSLLYLSESTWGLGGAPAWLYISQLGPGYMSSSRTRKERLLLVLRLVYLEVSLFDCVWYSLLESHRVW